MKQLLLAVAIIFSICSTPQTHAAGGDEDKPKAKTVCGMLQEMCESMTRLESSVSTRLERMEEKLTGLEGKMCEVQQRVDRVESTLGGFEEGEEECSIEQEICSDKTVEPTKPQNDKPRATTKQVYSIDDLTGETNLTEDGHYLLTLQNRSVRIKLQYGPRTQTSDLHEGRIIKASPVLSDHLVHHGYAKYLGKVGQFLVEFKEDYKFPSHSPYKGEKYKKGTRYEIDWEKANALLHIGNVIVLPQ